MISNAIIMGDTKDLKMLINQQRDEIIKANARKHELEAALAPFAAIPDNGAHAGAWKDDHVVFARDNVELTVGDFKRAREICNTKQG